jgi:hypothetical protein
MLWWESCALMKLLRSPVQKAWITIMAYITKRCEISLLFPEQSHGTKPNTIIVTCWRLYFISMGTRECTSQSRYNGHSPCVYSSSIASIPLRTKSRDFRLLSRSAQGVFCITALRTSCYTDACRFFLVGVIVASFPKGIVRACDLWTHCNHFTPPILMRAEG